MDIICSHIVSDEGSTVDIVLSIVAVLVDCDDNCDDGDGAADYCGGGSNVDDDDDYYYQYGFDAAWNYRNKFLICCRYCCSRPKMMLMSLIDRRRLSLGCEVFRCNQSLIHHSR